MFKKKSRIKLTNLTTVHQTNHSSQRGKESQRKERMEGKKTKRNEDRLKEFVPFVLLVFLIVQVYSHQYVRVRNMNRLVIGLALFLSIATCAFGLADTQGTTPVATPSFKELMAKYGKSEPALRGITSASSFLEVSSKAGVKAAGGCEVCVYVVENKQMHQPFLCRGLKDPAYQQTCVSALISMMWWLENQVYWVNYGCQRKGANDQWEWVKPCPAHAVCSWMQNLYDREPFCPLDPKYQKPSRR